MAFFGGGGLAAYKEVDFVARHSELSDQLSAQDIIGEYSVIKIGAVGAPDILMMKADRLKSHKLWINGTGEADKVALQLQKGDQNNKIDKGTFTFGGKYLVPVDDKDESVEVSFEAADLKLVWVVKNELVLLRKVN